MGTDRQLTELLKYASKPILITKLDPSWWSFQRFWVRLGLEMWAGAVRGMAYADGVTGVSRAGRRDVRGSLHGRSRHV